MINKKFNLSNLTWFAIAGLLVFSCERDISDDAVLATFPDTAEVYTDNPVGLTDEFFISFDPNAGANPDAFGTDDNVSYQGTSSIRLDVPAPNDPNGGFVGGIFRDRGNGRNLTSYNALTFWVKASKTAVFDEVGFGTDFEEDRYPVIRRLIPLSTDWKKVIIPIPDSSKLVQEKGMFFFSTGTENSGGEGFVIWIDEIRFENLGTIGQERPRIYNGQDLVVEGFVDAQNTITGLTYTVNTADGQDVTVIAAPTYYAFTSTDVSVANPNEFGVINVQGVGEATITATVAGKDASGSITLQVDGPFNFAPTPTRDPDDVISIFSDAYENIPVSRYNSFFAPFQTTQGGVIQIAGQSILSYTELNFVGIVFNPFIFPAEAVPTVNATNMTHLHIDVNVQEDLQPNARLLLELTNYGATETVGGFTIQGSQLESNEWVGFDIPLANFAGLADRNALGLLLFNSDVGGSPSISNLYLDNIYFFSEE